MEKWGARWITEEDLGDEKLVHLLLMIMEKFKGSMMSTTEGVETRTRWGIKERGTSAENQAIKGSARGDGEGRGKRDCGRLRSHLGGVEQQNSSNHGQ